MRIFNRKKSLRALSLSLLVCCSWSSLQASLEDDLKNGEEFMGKVAAYKSSFKGEIFKGKDLFFLLGPSRIGKSTILNLLAGNKLSGKLSPEGSWEIDVVQPVAQPVAKIGHGASETLFPNFWSDNKDTLFFDSAGLNDTRGPAIDVARALIMQTVGENARSVKFAIISEMHDIQTQNINFRSTISQLKEAIPTLNEANSVVIATKVDSYLNESHVTKSLEKQSFPCSNVAIFHKPNQEGPIEGPSLSKTISSISKAIDSAPALPSNKDLFKISLSSDTSNKLTSYANAFKWAIQESFKNLGTEIQSHYATLIKESFDVDNTKVKSWKTDIEGLYNNIKNVTTIKELVNGITPGIQFLNKNKSSVYSNQHILDIEKRGNYLIDLKNIQESITYDIKEWVLGLDPTVDYLKTFSSSIYMPTAFQTNGNCLVCKGYFPKVSEITSQWNQNITSIQVYGLNTVKIDSDVNLPGVNFLIMAPKVNVIDSKKNKYYWEKMGKIILHLQRQEGIAIPQVILEEMEMMALLVVLVKLAEMGLLLVKIFLMQIN